MNSRQDNDYKIEPRSQFMGIIHTVGFVIALIIAFLLILAYSEETTPMLIYDESEIYSCSSEYMAAIPPMFKSLVNDAGLQDDMMKQAFNKPDDKRFQEDPFTHYIREDMFYNPMRCKPLYQNNTDPIWFGRVENMKKSNQHIMVYGFVTLDANNKEEWEANIGREFEINYKLTVRGKSSDEFGWTLFKPHHNTVTAHCEVNADICTYFPVGFVPFLEYQMYDVAIEILPSETLSALQQTHVDFHIAYFNPQFTREQLIMKSFFAGYSFLVLLAWSVKMFYLIFSKNTDRDLFPFDTWCTWILIALLVGFNDPLYIFHVNDPNFITYFLTEFGVALFVAALLIFWVRDIARRRSDKLDANATKMQKFLHSSMAMSKGTLYFLVFWYLAMVIVFTALYCTFYTTVEGDPGAGELSINQKVKGKNLKIALATTFIVLAIYYIYYFLSLCNNIRIIVDLDKATIIIFAFSQVFHFLFICGVLLGAFSRHFENGGVTVFFYGVCNLYVWSLAYLNWPTEYYLKEYDIDMNEDRKANNHADVVDPQQIELEDAKPKNKFVINDEDD